MMIEKTPFLTQRGGVLYLILHIGDITAPAISYIGKLMSGITD